MVDGFVLRNGGDYVLRNGGDRILRNPDVVVSEGGGSGGTSRAIGHSLVKKQLGDKKSVESSGNSIGKIRIPHNGTATSAISILTKARAESAIRLTETTKGFTHSMLSISTKNESKSYIRIPEVADGVVRESQQAFFEPTTYELKQYYERKEKIEKLAEILKLFHEIEGMDDKE